MQTLSMKQDKKIVLSIFSLFLLVCLYVGLAKYTFPAADDYANAVILSETEFISAQINAWKSWTGRFTSTAIMHITYLLGINYNYGWHVLIFVSLSCGALFFLVSSLFSKINITQKILISLLLQISWLAIAVGLNENLYWFNGSFYYYTSIFIILELAAIANICNDHRPRINFIVCALFIFLNSAVIELSALYQVFIFAFAATVSWLSNKKHIMIYMLLLMFIAILGVAVQLSAPGNYERAKAISTLGGNPQNIITTIRIAILGGLSTSFLFFSKPIVYVLLLFLPFIKKYIAVFSFIAKIPIKIKLWHIIFFQILTAMGFQAISGYSQGIVFPTRAEGLIVWIMALQWIFFFVFCYRNEKFEKWVEELWLFRYKTFILALALILNGNFFAVLNDYFVGPEYSRQLNARYQYIEEQKKLGNLDLIVPQLTVKLKLLFFTDIEGLSGSGSGSTPNDWKNIAYADYFGIKSIRTALPSLLNIARAGNIKREVEAIINSAKNGNVIAQYELFKIYSLGNIFINKNKQEALFWLLMAASQDSKEAQRFAGGWLRRGWGTPYGKPDYYEAAKWYLRYFIF